jgi:hypothetical protein
VGKYGVEGVEGSVSMLRVAPAGPVTAINRRAPLSVEADLPPRVCAGVLEAGATAAACEHSAASLAGGRVVSGVGYVGSAQGELSLRKGSLRHESVCWSRSDARSTSPLESRRKRRSVAPRSASGRLSVAFRTLDLNTSRFARSLASSVKLLKINIFLWCK